MKTDVLFVGSKFKNNHPLREYIIRQINKKLPSINSTIYFKENDNSLFLHLEQELASDTKLIIITTKSNFSVIGKLLCTITADNQVLKEKMLIPSMSALFEERTYLLNYKNSIINVIQADEEQPFAAILTEDENSSAIIHIFEDDRESALALLSPIAKTNEVDLEITTLISGWHQINITSRRYGNISQFITSSKQLLHSQIISAANVVAYIIEKLNSKKKKITFAESCTGGLLAYKFTKESGTSAVYDGSLITYSNTLKENWLAVEANILNEYGAVSANVVEQMSDGALSVSYADYAISISGIAGPSGAVEGKPVGTVFISVQSKTNQILEKLSLHGDRNYVQEQSALYAIKMLLSVDKDLFFKN